MEASIAEQVQEPAARTTARSMFKYSEYLNVGEGAVECPTAVAIAAGEKEIPVCDDPDHFHAWCRLPNPYQHEDIREKGQAAKARKIRELKDPDSDASVILDQELADSDDAARIDQLVDELIARDWGDDYLQAEQEVSGREEFEHITQDREEYNRLAADQGELPEDEQSTEFTALTKHLGAYIEAIRAQLEAIQEPKRVELLERSHEQIVGLVRSRRVEEKGDRTFLDVYNAWTWFVGTFRVQLHPTLRRPHVPMWDEIGHRDRPAAGTMFGEAPEVIEALKTTFNSLQMALQRGSAGN